MEKRKNKKKLFAIIGGSVLAFVLTIALSVSVTLAYFGQVGAGTATVTMGGSVEVGSSLTMTDTTATAVPGQTITVKAAGQVTSNSTQTAAAVMLVKAASATATGLSGEEATANTISNLELFADAGAQTTTAPEGWEKVGTVYTAKDVAWTLYVYGTQSAMTKITAKSTATSVIMQGQMIVPTTLTNAAAGKALTFEFKLVAAQYGTQDQNTATLGYSALQTILETVGGYQTTNPTA